MAQDNRVILPGLPHYVTQCGRSGDYSVFREPTDYRVFLHLLEESCGRNEVAIWGYTLLARSYSLILVPENTNSLDLAMRRLDSEYAHYHNLRNMVRGAVWNGTYRSAAMCWSEVWDAMLYAERDPVREDGVGVAWGHPWSSAAARLGRATPAPWLELGGWEQHWTIPQWTRQLQVFPNENEFGHKLAAALEIGATLGEMLTDDAFAAREPVARIGPQRAASAPTRMRVIRTAAAS
jgi:hypothetical protein